MVDKPHYSACLVAMFYNGEPCICEEVTKTLNSYYENVGGIEE